MTIEFKLPEVSEGVTSADIAEIHVAEGDVIEAGQIVLEVETEKAVADIPCPHAGKVTKILVKKGDSVPVGAPLLTLEAADGVAAPAPKKSGAPPAAATAPKTEAPKPAPAPEPPKQAAPPEPPKPAAKPATPVTATASASATAIARVDDNGSDRAPAPAAPSTRRLARELGVDLHRVAGSGPGGRITSDDVQGYVRTLTSGAVHDVSGPMTAPQLPDFNRFGAIERKPMSKLARTAAANLSLAWQMIPHVTQHELCDVTELEESRQNYMKTIGQNGPKITMTAIMAKAVVGALKAFPNFNSSIDVGSNELIIKQYYNIGIAVDTEYGLVVPVIRDVDRKSVLAIASEINELSVKARDRKLEMADMQGGTFTITNLGGIGGTAFTPIVNYPEVAILGMSRSKKQWDFVDGKPVERLMLPLSLSYDHRVVNGADAARFIVKLSRILSDFFQLLIEC
jgi:pyruvate dehydrogenase E2 component (dihydrolipoamide acetyltransferase)